MNCALDIRDLTVTFGRSDTRPVVHGVSLSIAAGQTMVVLGESGSGKSVTARSILGLHGSSARVAGSIRVDDREIVGLADEDMNRMRGRTVAMIPQDPSSALDPLRRVSTQFVEALLRHRSADSRLEARAKAAELLALVGIGEPERVMRSYPHQLSGGMLQRVLIAIAISSTPQLLVADEPTTALDVTVQAQVLGLFGDLVRRLGSALLLVTHDIGVARQVADIVAVMYQGRIVEYGPARAVLNSTGHPYTRALLNSLPRVGVPRGGLIPIPSPPPAAAEHLPGCLATGDRLGGAACRRPASQDDHWIACPAVLAIADMALARHGEATS